MYYTEQDIESRKMLLDMCYDRVVEINSLMCIAVSRGKYGIIDVDNNTLVPFQAREICTYGKVVCIADFSSKYIFDLKTMKLTRKYVIDIKEVAGMTIVDTGYKGVGLLDSDGYILLPFIYTSIRYIGVRGMYHQFWIAYNERNFYINITMDTKHASALDVICVEDSNISFVAVDYEGDKLKYEISVSGQIVTNGRYDELYVSSCDRLLQTVTCRKNKKLGVVALDGRELIPVLCDRIDCVGYRELYLIQIDNKWGVYKAGQGLISSTLFDLIQMSNELPIQCLGKKCMDNIDWYFIGNDACIHKNMTAAFDIYKKRGEELYIVNVYGHYVFTDSNFKQVKGEYAGEWDQIAKPYKDI